MPNTEGFASLALRNASRRLLRLQQLTAALSRASTAERVVAAVVTHALEPLEACAGFIGLVEGGDLAITRALGPDEPELPPCRFPLSARVPAADAVRARAAILVESPAARVERYPSWNTGRWAGYGAWAALPLLADGEPLGAMLLCFPEERAFGDEDRAFMETVATVCAQALDRARLCDREQRARQEVADADRRKDEFLAILGHELRNPLAAIVTAVELTKLLGVEPTREQRVIERQVQSLVRLVDDLLDVSRITRGAIDLRKEPMELGGAISKALEIARPLAARKRQRLEVSVAERGLQVTGDPFRLGQVLTNLLTNAVKYTPEGGAIELTARREGPHVVVCTKDTGIGIAPDLLPRIFAPFVQGGSPPHGYNTGLGIGLTLAQRLVELHGGTVAAKSEGAGRGSEFVVRLPALDAQPSAADPAAPPP
jgi:signal transduction histidine kinase